MNTQVRYYSRSGNTRKLAEAVATALGVDALDTSTNLTERADVLFLGSSLYAGTCDKAVKNFVETNKDNIGTIVCFGSSASGRSTHSKLTKLAKELGVNIHEEYFNCAGHFLFMHKERPNAKDCNAAGEFAKTTLAKLS